MNQNDNNSSFDLPPATEIGDQNIERLLGQSYRPERIDPAFADRLEAAMCAAAHEAARERTTAVERAPNTVRRSRSGPAAAWTVAATLLLAAGFTIGRLSGRHAGDGNGIGPASTANTPPSEPDAAPSQLPALADPSRISTFADSATIDRYAPMSRPVLADSTVPWGVSLDTGPGERRRVVLPDHSVLFLNEDTQLSIDAERQIALRSGEIYVEVAPRAEQAELKGTFFVRTMGRDITALGTKFAVRAMAAGTDVLVTQGRVRLSDVEQAVGAGQQVLARGDSEVLPLPRASAVLDWTRDLVAAAEGPLVPASTHAGGSLVARDAAGGETRLSLRKYHVDVHIEDGFARTTIDQTYFNHTSMRLEGTFHFPLPPDASLSRLAMYVEGKLMEGGMAERTYARDVFEKIVRTQKDPALLEWVDGSTFKMRVFPLEPRQEKRIVLSYTQRLESLYGHMKYRFPAGHSLGTVREWSFHGRVKRGGELAWSCDSHELKPTQDGGDLVLDAAATDSKMDRDIVLRLTDRGFDADPRRGLESIRFSATVHEAQRYLMLRFRPELPAKMQRQRRDWIFLFESSGDRDPILARTQADVIKTLLRHVEHDDTFVILTAGTQTRSFAPDLVGATAENVKKAIKFLDQVHLVGALDLTQAFQAAAPFVKAAKNPYLVHLGSGIPVLGDRADEKLLEQLPAGARYIGVAIGNRWARQFMKNAAARTAGYFTHMNPDEPIAWRAFDLYSTLNTPRLLAVTVNDVAERAAFLSYADSIAHGEELCAIARIPAGDPIPQKLVVTGTVDGQPFRREMAVADVVEQADYLPRSWARLRIDQLLAQDPARHRDEIISLSKAMYVMSPFTSLLVLETEQMYAQFGVDRGRKDHWAMYACPDQIPVVYEPSATPIRVTGMDRPLQSIDEVYRTLAPGLTAQPLTSEAADVLREWPRYVKPWSTTAVWGALWEADRPAAQTQALSFYDFAFPNGRYANGYFHYGEGSGEKVAAHYRLQPRIMLKEMAEPPVALQQDLAKLTDVTMNDLWFMDEYRLDGIFKKFGRQLGEITKSGAFGESAEQWVLGTELRLENEYWEKNLLGIASQPESSLHRNGRRLHWSSFDFDPSLSRGFAASQVTERSPSRGFHDLVAYIPAVHTSSADVMAILDATLSDVTGGIEGDIDANARALIDNARKTSWQSVSFATPHSTARDNLVVDGSGRFVLRRTTGSGLHEEIICDGESLCHVYRELGIATKRPMSRFHRAEFRAAVPWLVPDPAELARDGDVITDGDRTVAIQPRTNSINGTDSIRMQLNFDPDGRIAERRWIRQSNDQVLMRETYGQDGTVRLVDSRNKTVSQTRFLIEPAAEPNLVPDLAGLVVLPMPARTTDFVFTDTGRPRNGLYADWTEQDALRLLVSLQWNLPQEVPQVVGQRFFARNDRRIGFYTLLLASGLVWEPQEEQRLRTGSVVRMDPVADHPESILARYVFLHARQMAKAGTLGELDLATRDRAKGDAGSGGFVTQLAAMRDLYVRFQQGSSQPSGDGSHERDRGAAIEFVRGTTSPVFAWLIYNMFKDRETTADAKRAWAEACLAIASAPELAYRARYEAARCYGQAGDWLQARQLFSELVRDGIERGAVPAFDAHLVQSFRNGDGNGAAQLEKLFDDAADALVGRGQRVALIAIARQCHEAGEAALAEKLLTRAVSGLAADDRPATMLAAVRYLDQTNQHARADDLIQPLLDQPPLNELAHVWRLGSEIAERCGRTARSAARLDRALDLEFKQLPPELPLEPVREQFGNLLNRYDQLAGSILSLGTEPPQDMVDRVIRAADRWRSLDPDDTAACHAAARVLDRLGQHDVAWEYATTPFAEKPAEQPGWLTLGQTLRTSGSIDLADRAYRYAALTEPQNAQILWDRAQMLEQAGRTHQAMECYRQLAEGRWPEQFQAIQDQARMAIDR